MNCQQLTDKQYWQSDLYGLSGLELVCPADEVAVARLVDKRLSESVSVL